MKPTGKTFFVSERHKALHHSTVNLLLHTCSKAAALPCTFLVVHQPNELKLYRLMHVAMPPGAISPPGERVAERSI